MISRFIHHQVFYLDSASMIKPLVVTLFLCIPIFGYSQKIRVGIAYVHENKFSVSQVNLPNGIVVSEGNKFPVSSEAPYLGYEFSLSERLKANVGVQYNFDYISLRVDVPPPPKFPFSTTKYQSVSNHNLEFPLELSYTVLEIGRIKWKLRGGVVPVFTISTSNELTEVPEGPDWSQEVVDALNAAETIPKSFYFNYQYGMALEYRRFELSVFNSANLSSSVSDGYTLNGTTYSFDRRIRSTRIGLYYTFGLKK